MDWNGELEQNNEILDISTYSGYLSQAHLITKNHLLNWGKPERAPH